MIFLKKWNFIRSKEKDEAEQAEGKDCRHKEELQKFRRLAQLCRKRNGILLSFVLPNIPHESVPAGKTAEDT